MLKDSLDLAARFNVAFPKDGTLQDIAIASACAVTKQAIPGWRATGRIAKKHLPALAKLSKRSLEWWISGDTPLDDGDNNGQLNEQDNRHYEVDDQSIKAVVALMRATDAVGRGIAWQAVKQALQDYLPDKRDNFEQRPMTG